MSLALELHEAVAHLPETTVSTELAVRRAINPSVLYCLAIVLLPVLAIPVCIALGASDFFLHHGASVWVQSNDSVFNMRGRQCDVVVYGDSTAMTGIDPDVVERETGFRVCNIAVTNAVLAVTGNLTLDHFLQNNARPKVVLVQLSPDDFQQENRVWQHTIYAEGLLELLRHGSPEESRRVLLSHPREAVSFAGYAAGFTAYYAIKDVLFRTTHVRWEEDQIHVRNGFFTPPSPARTFCDASEKLADMRDNFPRNLADDYRSRYTKLSDVVLVDVAPIPVCDDNLSAFENELKGITSNSLQPLPIGLFNDGRHYTGPGSRVVSTLVARQVNQVAIDNPGIDDRIPVTSAKVELRSVALHR